MERKLERKHEKYERLIARCKSLPPTRTAVAHPCDESSLQAAIDAANAGLIAPILVGPRARIEALAKQHGIDVSKLEVVDAPNSEASAAAAVALVREGRAQALMKGSLHTDELMGAVVRRETGLRTARRISHCFIMDVPGHPEPLVITDAARARSGHGRGAGGDSLGDGDDQSRRAFHAGGGCAVQDGGPQADHGR